MENSNRGSTLLNWLTKGLRWLRLNLLRPRFLVALAVLAFVTGLVGFEVQRKASDLSDSIYRTIQLFGLNYEELPAADLAIDSGGDGRNAWIESSRLLAALVVFSAVLTLFYVQLRDRLTLFLQTSGGSYRNRVVLLGFGSVNTALARFLARKGVPVTAVSKEFTQSDRELARLYRMLLIPGDISDPATLAFARVGRAGHVVVATGRDVENVEIGTAAAGFAEAVQAVGDNLRIQDSRDDAPAGRHYGCNEMQEPVVRIHLSSTRTLADLTEARDAAYAKGAGASFFSIRAEAARRLVSNARFAQRAADMGRDRVHVVLCGLGDQGMAIVEELLLTCWSPLMKKPPRITIIDCVPACDAEARLRAYRPRLFDGSLRHTGIQPKFEFVQHDLEHVCFEDDGVLDSMEANDPPCAWVFACGSDNTNLAAALRLEMAMRRLRRLPAPIHTRLWGAEIGASLRPAEDDAIQELFHDHERNPLLMNEVFGSIASLLPDSELANQLVPGGEQDLPQVELLARQLHRTYQCQGSGAGNNGEDQVQERYLQPWTDLPSAERESNRRAVRHICFKLMDMGFRWRGMGEGRLPRLSAEDARLWMSRIEDPVRLRKAFAGKGNAHEEVLVKAARAEHDRWMAHRALEGWEYSPVRDNAARLHDDMVSFARLPAERKPNDLTWLAVVCRASLLDEQARTRPLARIPAPPRRLSFDVTGSGEARPLISISGLDRPLEKDVAELEVRVPASLGERFPTRFGYLADHLPANEADRLIGAVKRWAAEPESAASRIHLVLERMNMSFEEHAAGQEFCSIRTLAARLQDIATETGLVLDVTYRLASNAPGRRRSRDSATR